MSTPRIERSPPDANGSHIVTKTIGTSDYLSATPQTALIRKRSKTESAARRASTSTRSVSWEDSLYSPRSTNRSQQSHIGSTAETTRNDSVIETEIEPRELDSTRREGQPDRHTPHADSKGAKKSRQESKDSRKSKQTKDHAQSNQRRPVQHRVGNLSRRPQEVLLRANPSLLSVLSTLTRASERSTDSAATITQQSYNQQLQPRPASKNISTNRSSSPASRGQSMDHLLEEDDADAHSTVSSAHSQYSPSESGSSEPPETPSSHSTYPSPTVTHSGSSAGSIAGLRRKHDHLQYSSRPTSLHVEHPSDHIAYSYHPDIMADSGHLPYPSVPPMMSDYAAPEYNEAQERLHQSHLKTQQQIHALRQHLAEQGALNIPEHHYIPSRSASAASHHSDRSSQVHSRSSQSHMQPYFPHSVARPSASPALHTAGPDQPPAPDAPDLSKKTLGGYELLALELADHRSPIQPVYRKFGYLNHRLLLHLQDELSEMEESLRRLDEIIAQLESSLANNSIPTASSSDISSSIEVNPPDLPPASRRRDAQYGAELHHQRTALLGRIFVKTEQYARALAAYNAMLRDCRPADPADVAKYRAWLRDSARAPVHELETRFLLAEADLVMPGATAKDEGSGAVGAAEWLSTTESGRMMGLLALAVILPIILFAFVPSMLGRLIVAGIIAGGAAAATVVMRLQDLLPTRERLIGGAAYILLISIMAGCMPLGGSEGCA